MRSPRALLPLLSVCGAAAVVTAAGAGAAIDGLSGGGPAHADGERGTPAVTIQAVTWNVCGEAAPGCPLGARPAELARRIVQQAASTEVGGRRVRPNAVFLQEVCAGQVQTLKKAGRLAKWSWAFAPFTRGPACADGQGRPGVAVGTDAALTGVRQVRLPSPVRLGRVALCGDVAAWGTRICTTQLSSPAWDEDPRGEWRRKQARALASLAGTGGRVVVGGDLAAGPESPAFDVLYRDYSECDQGPGPARTGAKTVQDWRGAAVEKNDYLFLSKSAGVSCGVPAAPVRASDHRPLSAVINFR
ncbi:endonuclease/exonuclease/phosphatase family protein [Actinomadura rubrisoli]|uniref:endonuclease/exonuclease/phosphatase family protein n=1 Tax=Actinomadura rubrisoli TaxID=2530368 RepID=UPI001FB61147|nr:endonuclease/exonuclease/phosphatase family protein [Actinomadura rubrisoli]